MEKTDGSRGLLRKLRNELKELSKNPNNIKDYTRFHKDNKSHIGLATPILRRVATKYYKIAKQLDKKTIFRLCEELMDTNEGRQIAFDWAFRLRKRHEKEDFKIFETWLEKYVHTWGSCDDLCTHAFGHFIFSYPEFIPKIHQWTKSNNKWKRRASAIIFIYSVRKGRYLKDSLKIAKALMKDNEDLVQKGYGWMLKEVSNSEQREVFDFVMKHKSVMPRNALRYAIEKMSQDLKNQAMN